MQPNLSNLVYQRDPDLDNAAWPSLERPGPFATCYLNLVTLSVGATPLSLYLQPC